MKKHLLPILTILLAFTLAGCEENLLVKAEPTPEGRATVDSVYDSIVGVEELEVIPPQPFREFITETIIGKRPSGMTPEEEEKRDCDEESIKEIISWLFGEDKIERNMPGLRFNFLQGFDLGDFEKLASLQTRADIAYMNEKLGSLCEPGKKYTEFITEYYNFLSSFTEGGVDGIINIKDSAQAELKIADVVTIRLATRFLFNTLVTSIYDDYTESLKTVSEYVSTLSTENIVYILTSHKVFDDITNTYTILNKLQGSTTIIDIGFLEVTE